ncbi:concanavalin A-like lectin/glucanase domain-containing protein [Cladorrhinum sp. PSN332]|nr:concanavalin A-like lectin/glucanase domain-containing protein [Cladorrhinum sp. PSN332]
MPSGRTRAESCGIWPAYWMFGPNWPNSGEIDILEGVNSQRSNSITLHTAEGCTMSNTTGSLASTRLTSSNCEGNSGCGQETESSSNYGVGFNSGGGGYYVMEWTEDSISVWFIPRDSGEAARLSAAMDTPSSSSDTADSSSSSSSSDMISSLGQPLATFIGGDDCQIANHFAEHNIVFDTTFCGDWAGRVWESDPTCSALASTCEEWVGQNPEKFVGAYWLINEVRVYQKKKGTNTKKRSVKREAVAFKS